MHALKEASPIGQKSRPSGGLLYDQCRHGKTTERQQPRRYNEMPPNRVTLVICRDIDDDMATYICKIQRVYDECCVSVVT